MNLEPGRSNPELISDGGARSQGLPLCRHVRIAVEQYFSELNGHPACGLYAMVLAEVEKPLIEAALEHTGHNQSRAAQVLGISRSTLRKKMEQHDLV